MINDINDLARHRRFISFLATGRTARPLARGGGGHANYTEKSGSTPTPTLTAAKNAASTPPQADACPLPRIPRKRGPQPNQLNAATISAITLSNALAILALPTLATLPQSLDSGPNTSRYERLKVLWSQWQSNARAIGNSVWVRHSNTHTYAIEQYDLTEAIIHEFKEYESHYL